MANRPTGKSERMVAAAGVAALHLGALGLLALGGGNVAPLGDVPPTLVFDLPLSPPPPAIVVTPHPARAPEPEGRAAPPGLRAEPTPVVAPVSRPTPSPIPAAPIAGFGAQADAGAADVPGPGTGAGGTGDGRGSGGAGSGTGGGGIAVRAELVSGRILPADYPREAWRSGAAGTVRVRFTVHVDGRARGCVVMRTSGHESLDRATCALIEQRFRYQPALDETGRPTAEERGWEQRWWGEQGR